MPKLKPIALCVSCALAMAGCAGTSPRQSAERPAAPVASSARPMPVTAEGMYRLARYYEGQKRHSQAIAAYREALQRNPLMVEAYTGLGMLLAAEGRHGEAIRQFQAAVVLAPDAAHAHNNLGYAYLLQGSYEQARKSLEEAQRLDPASETSRQNLRVAQAKLGGPVPEPITAQPLPASPAASEPASGITLVQVAPQILELKAEAGAKANAKAEAEPRIAAARSFRLEVANGNGVNGLARRVADRLAANGVPTARVTNQRPFQQARTELHYRDGYAAEAARLAEKLQQPVALVPSRRLATHIDVQLLLGRDALAESALFAPARADRVIARAPNGA